MDDSEDTSLRKRKADDAPPADVITAAKKQKIEIKEDDDVVVL